MPDPNYGKTDRSSHACSNLLHRPGHSTKFGQGCSLTGILMKVFSAIASTKSPNNDEPVYFRSRSFSAHHGYGGLTSTCLAWHSSYLSTGCNIRSDAYQPLPLRHFRSGNENCAVQSQSVAPLVWPDRPDRMQTYCPNSPQLIKKTTLTRFDW